MTVRVQIRKLEHAYAPRFTVCPAGSGTTLCTAGPLPAAQSDELEASVPVGSHAAVGGRVDLTATASATGAHYGDASGTVTLVAAASAHPSPSSSTSTVVPPVTLPPGTASGTGAGVGAGTGISPTDPAGLFPIVSPGPTSSSPGIRLPPATKPHARARAVTASATVPLDSRLIGGQLLGLAVLAGAIVIAIARLSLRTPRPQDGPGKSK